LGFRDAKRQLIECLFDGRIDHELERSEIIVKATHGGTSWYIKWYFLDPNVMFISVHE